MPLDVLAVDHIGIRVAERERALAFYRLLGFEQTAHYPAGHVTIVRNRAGVELNLIDNANASAGTNVLLDVPDKHPGITHVALRVASLADTERALAEAGIPLSGGPERLGDGVSLFVRDPDRNVIELREALG